MGALARRAGRVADAKLLHHADVFVGEDAGYRGDAQDRPRFAVCALARLWPGARASRTPRRLVAPPGRSGGESDTSTTFLSLSGQHYVEGANPSQSPWNSLPVTGRFGQGRHSFLGAPDSPGGGPLKSRDDDRISLFTSRDAH